MHDLSRRELEARLGSAHDALGPQVAVIDTGPERGCRTVTLTSGDGLEVTMNLDRGMAARDASWEGKRISFASQAGEAHPGAYEPYGLDWLRTWPGGLVATCGFRNVGPPGDADGEHHGIHGRADTLAARDVKVGGSWEGDRFVSTVSGMLREARLFGEHIEVRRTWRLEAGTSTLELTDEIRNAGFRPEPVLLLYHINLGWPILDDGSHLQIDGDVEPRDERAAEGLDRWPRIDPPEPGITEQVFFHDVPAGPNGRATAKLTNPRMGTFEVSWRPEQLPCFTQWRCLASGAYALGLEPANCRPLGRRTELEAGRGDVLEPGETKSVDLTVGMKEPEPIDG